MMRKYGMLIEIINSERPRAQLFHFRGADPEAHLGADGKREQTCHGRS